MHSILLEVGINHISGLIVSVALNENYIYNMREKVIEFKIQNLVTSQKLPIFVLSIYLFIFSINNNTNTTTIIIINQ